MVRQADEMLELRTAAEAAASQSWQDDAAQLQDAIAEPRESRSLPQVNMKASHACIRLKGWTVNTSRG